MHTTKSLEKYNEPTLSASRTLTQFPLLKLTITFITDIETPQKKLIYYQYPAFLATTASMNGAPNNPLCFPKLIQNGNLILIADPTTDQNKLCPDLTHLISGLAASHM